MTAEEFLIDIKKPFDANCLLRSVVHDVVAQRKEYAGYVYFFNSFRGYSLMWHNLKSNATGGVIDLWDTVQAALYDTRQYYTFSYDIAARMVRCLSVEELSVLILLEPRFADSAIVRKAMGVTVTTATAAA